MLGFRTDGVHLVSAPDSLKTKLKNKNIPLVTGVTGNTLVFAINNPEVVVKRVYAPSFMAGDSPWFVCVLGDFPAPTDNTLAFDTEDDLADFITAMYYASQGFLHLDFELSDFKMQFCASHGKIRVYEEKDFPAIPKEAFVACFCFSNGGFMESDRLFLKLSKECGLDMGRILLMGTFDSKYNYTRGFVIS